MRVLTPPPQECLDKPSPGMQTQASTDIETPIDLQRAALRLLASVSLPLPKRPCALSYEVRSQVTPSYTRYHNTRFVSAKWAYGPK
jgi:hypothetical protein